LKTLLHIGQSKTGTSAIQAFLAQNRRELSASGVLYPQVRVGRLLLDVQSHNAVADALVGVTSIYPHLTAQQYFDQFRAEAERTGAEQMVLSAEHFFGGQPRVWDVPDEDAYLAGYAKKIEALTGWLRGHEITVLVYLRPQVEWLASAIGQAIRYEGLMQGRRIYESDRQYFEMSRPLLRYSRLLDLWRRILAPATMLVIPYRREDLVGGDSVSDFLVRSQLDHLCLSSAITQADVNPSLSVEYLEVKKLLNREPRTKSQERVAIECLDRLSRQSSRARSYQLDDEVVATIVDYVADDNASLNARYMNTGRPFVARPDSAQPAVRELLSDDEVRAAMTRFTKEYRRPRNVVRAMDYGIRRFLRQHAAPVHAMLHKAKRAVKAVRHRQT